MNIHKERKDIVFMNFTAKWCLTCKVNEYMVLNTNKFKEFIRQNDIALLKADWTKRGPEIQKFLLTHGHVGIPAYFLQDKKGNIIKLGEIITINKIKRNIAKLQKSE